MKITAARIPARPLLAILPPLLAFLLQWIFWSFVQPYAWSLFYPAIFISAWIGGRMAGLRATVISVVLVWWFFVPPFFPLQESSLGTAFSTLAFVATAILISFATNRLRQAKQRLSIAAAEARAASAQLSDAEGEIAQMQQQTEALDKYHAMLLSKVSDAVFAADKNFLITYWNPAAERIYGWSAAEAIGHSAAELMHSIFPGTSREEVLQTLRRTGQFQGELHQFTKDGRKLTLLGNTAALYDANGEFAGYVTVNHDITEKMRQEEELKEHVRQFSDLYNQAPCGYHSLDKHGRFIKINDTELGWLGYQRDEVVGKLALQDLLTFASATVFRQSFFPVLMQRGWIQDLELEFVRKDGSLLPVIINASAIRDENGDFLMCRSTVADNTARKQAEQQLRQAAIVFDATNEAVMITDAECRITKVNRAFEIITGFSGAEAIGKTPRILNSGRQSKEFYQHMWAELIQTGHWQGELWNRRRNGELFPAWETLNVIKNDLGDVTHHISVMSDISAIKGAQEHMDHLAHHDALTGLPNRLLFSGSLDGALERAERQQKKLALLFLDLDRFKLINDTMGHAAGDILLQQVAARLQACVRAEDMVARLGGDEFTVVLENLATPEDASHVACKIIEAFARPIPLPQKDIVTSTSIGISIYPDDAANAEDLCKAADAAMYRAKERGRNTYEYYTAEIAAQAQRYLNIEAELRQALSRGELELCYQAQVALDSEQIVGVEALLRWNHPNAGQLLPGHFIAIAEESGLIEPIDDWVIRQAFRQASQWVATGITPGSIAINLSGRKLLHNNLVWTVQAAQQASGLQASDVQIELEITETAMMAVERRAETLAHLRALGVKIAIDDFGTGYSSLSRLKHLPLDTLKIDRQFLSNIASHNNDTEDRAIVRAIMSLGHSLGLRVVAEGVETEDQLSFLRQHGCDEAQGFLFDKPMSAAAMTARLAQCGQQTRH